MEEGFISGSIIRLLLMMWLILNCKGWSISAGMSSRISFLSQLILTVTKDGSKLLTMKLSTSKSQPLPQNSTFTSIECPWLNSSKAASASTLTTSPSISDTPLHHCSTIPKFTCIQSSMPELSATRMCKTINKNNKTIKLCSESSKIYYSRGEQLAYRMLIFPKPRLCLSQLWLCAWLQYW